MCSELAKDHFVARLRGVVVRTERTLLAERGQTFSLLRCRERSVSLALQSDLRIRSLVLQSEVLYHRRQLWHLAYRLLGLMRVVLR